MSAAKSTINRRNGNTHDSTPFRRGLRIWHRIGLHGILAACCSHTCRGVVALTAQAEEARRNRSAGLVLLLAARV